MVSYSDHAPFIRWPCDMGPLWPLAVCYFIFGMAIVRIPNAMRPNLYFVNDIILFMDKPNSELCRLHCAGEVWYPIFIFVVRYDLIGRFLSFMVDHLLLLVVKYIYDSFT